MWASSKKHAVPRETMAPTPIRSCSKDADQHRVTTGAGNEKRPSLHGPDLEKLGSRDSNPAYLIQSQASYR